MVFLLLRGWCSAASVTSYFDEGDCFSLASRYLKAVGEPYIIDSRLKEYSCSWHFAGDTKRDFEQWCKISGLRCSGRPYYVGFDSVWYRGEYMPAPRASWLRKQDAKQDSVEQYNASLQLRSLARSDSLLSLPPLPKKRASIEYLELGKSTADYLGFSYSDFIGSARFFSYDNLFSVTLQAKKIGDTSFVYRTYSSVYDSSLSVFWGGSRERLTTSNITSNGVVSNNYELENFGLSFVLNNLKYTYEHSTDYEHKIGGSGLLTPGVNHIFGSYQYTSRVVRSVPFLSSVPVLGVLFSHSSDVVETRYIFISVYINELLEDVD